MRPIPYSISRCLSVLVLIFIFLSACSDNNSGTEPQSQEGAHVGRWVLEMRQPGLIDLLVIAELNPDGSYLLTGLDSLDDSVYVNRGNWTLVDTTVVLEGDQCRLPDSTGTLVPGDCGPALRIPQDFVEGDWRVPLDQFIPVAEAAGIQVPSGLTDYLDVLFFESSPG